MERNKLISVLQVLGIILVVLGHCQSKVFPKPLWFEWIYTFHMPLFVFISGYLLQYSNRKKGIALKDIPWMGRQGMLWKKTKRLLLPYFVISSLAFLPKGLMNQFALRPVDVSLGGYLQMLAYPMDNVISFFWFLPTLFLLFVLVRMTAELNIQGRYKLLPFLGLTIALCLHIWSPFTNVDDSIGRFFNIGGAVSYLFYFVLGYYCCEWHVIGKIKIPPFALFLITATLSILFVTVIPEFPGQDVLAAINGILLSISFCQIYLQKSMTFLDHLFGASYAIYLFSWFPQTFSQQVIPSVLGVPQWAGGLLAFVTGLYLPLLIYKWMMLHRKGKIGKIIVFLCGH